MTTVVGGGVKKAYEVIGKKSICGKKRVIYKRVSGKPTRNKLSRSLNEFVENAFTPEGTYKTDGKFLAIAGKNNKHCKYCEFKDQLDLCAKQERIK